MTPIKTITTTRKTTLSMTLGAGQVEAIVRDWAIKKYGFTTAVDVESRASHGAYFDCITLNETRTEDVNTANPYEGCV